MSTSTTRKYPCYLQLDDKGPIVRFISANCGIVIHDPTEQWRIGFLSESWMNAEDEIMYSEVTEEEADKYINENIKKGLLYGYVFLDYVLEEVHESKIGWQSNYTYSVLFIYDSLSKVERELKKEKYKWRGNGTGSVSYKARRRIETDKLEY